MDDWLNIQIDHHQAAQLLPRYAKARVCYQPAVHNIASTGATFASVVERHQEGSVQAVMHETSSSGAKKYDTGCCAHCNMDSL